MASTLRRSCCSSPSSAAHLFVQLSKQRGVLAADFLAPRQAVSRLSTAAPSPGTRRCAATGDGSAAAVAAAAAAGAGGATTQHSRFRGRDGGGGGGGAEWRTRRRRWTSGVTAAARGGATFATSAPRRRTRAVLNPRLDEDGGEMVLEITARAAQRLSEIMARDSNPDLALRIQVESGGCHGFQYLMSLTTLPVDLTTAEGDKSAVAASETPAATAAVAVGEDDTVFSFLSDDGGDGGADATTAAALPKVVLDGPSLELLRGSKVDFTTELIGSQFKIVDNPLATSSCGCGTSFDIKI